MGIQMTAEAEVELVGHVLGDVAVQVEHRAQHDVGPDRRADLGAQVGLEVVEALCHTGTVQFEQDGVDGTRGFDAVEQTLLHGGVGVGGDRARRSGLRVVGGDDVDAPLGGLVEHPAQRRPAPLRVQDLLADRVIEVLERGQTQPLVGEGVGLVCQSADRDAHRRACPSSR